MDAQVARLTAAAQALVAIETPQDAQHVIRLAEAARVYARQAELGAEAENAATAIRLKAEIRLAETVTAGQEAGEIASQSEGGANIGVRDADTVPPATLPELGITRQRLSEARTIAGAFTLPAIDGMAQDATDRGTTLSRAAVLREAVHEANGEFDRIADSLIDPATRGRNAIAHFEASLHGAHLAFDAIGRPLTEDEARAPSITLTALQSKLRGNRKARLEVVE
jgi:hypothetical protein